MKYLLITQDKDLDSKGFKFRIREFTNLRHTYTAWIKGNFDGYIAKEIDPKVSE